MHLCRRTLLLAGLAATAVTGCSTPGPPPDHPEGKTTYSPTPPDAPEALKAADMSQRLGWKLLRLNRSPDNRMMSPASLSSVLALMGLGASGESAARLDELFGMEAVEWARGIDALRNSLKDYDSLPASMDSGDPPETPVVHIASRLLLCGGGTPKESFLNIAKETLDAGVDRVSDAEAQASMDSWVRKHTAELIEDSGLEFGSGTELVAQDTLLFSAAWQQQFTSDNVPLTFTTDDDKKIALTAMSGEFNAPTATGERWKAVRLRYDANLAMDVLFLTKSGHPLGWGEEVLIESHEALSKAPDERVRVTMPVMDLTQQLDFMELLDLLKVDIEDFDGIFDGAKIQQTMQRARIQVAAQGTIGAAATESGEATATPPSENVTEFIANRPYLMRVLDTRSGWPLFLTIISDPQE